MLGCRRHQLGKVGPCDIQKLIKSLKLREDCGIDSIPNGCPILLPRRPLFDISI
jgi:hypothetical protein